MLFRSLDSIYRVKGVDNMSVVKPLTQSLELIYVKDISDSGKPLLETRRFRNVKVDAAPDSVHEVATAMAEISLGTFSQFQITVASELAAVA